MSMFSKPLIKAGELEYLKQEQSCGRGPSEGHQEPRGGLIREEER